MSETPDPFPDFDVEVHHERNLIGARVHLRGELAAGTKVAFYLFRNGVIHERRAYSTAERASFPVADAGQYSVKAFLRSGKDKVSKPSASLAVEDLDANSRRRIPPLPFTPLDLPHRDIAVLSSTRGGDPIRERALNDVERRTGMRPSRFETSAGVVQVLHAEGADCGNGRTFFSGMSATDDRFVFGPADVDTGRLTELKDAVGEFMLVNVTEDAVTVETDFFGVGKVYYFAGHGIACAANRMHLLIELLHAAGVPLRPNKTKMRAGLQATSQVFTQNFSARMDLEDCYCLPPGSALRIAAGQVELSPTSISAVFDEPTDQQVTPREYNSLLDEACKEMVRNLRVALEHPAFDRVRLDVTGGMDSRMLFAALSRLPEFAGHVELHTADFATSPHDLPISLRLSREAPFPYDTGRRETYDVDSDTSLLENLSFNLGAYFGNRAESTRTRLPGTLCVNGFFGEAAARPYFARLIYGQPTEELDYREYPGAHVSRLGANHRTTFEYHELASLFRDEFERLPGSTSSAKFDAFYIFHRNGLHCSDRWRSHVRAPSWGPLQSKVLFALKWRTLDTFRDITVQVDATEKLNHELAMIPLGRRKDNLDREQVSPKYLPGDDNMTTQLGITAEDRARFNEGGAQRRRNSERLQGDDSEALQAKNAHMLRNHREWVLSGLDELENEHHMLSPTEAKELRSYVNYEYDAASKYTRPAGTVITNKVLSAVYLCRASTSETFE